MDITDAIFNILDLASDYSKSSENSQREILVTIEEHWEKLPEEKYENQERALIAEFMIDEYIKFEDYDSAYSWADILLADRQDNLSNVGMVKGKIDFESGNYDSAFKNFEIAFKDSKGREFEGEDSKYKDFYLNPEKYTNS